MPPILSLTFCDLFQLAMVNADLNMKWKIPEINDS